MNAGQANAVVEQVAQDLMAQFPDLVPIVVGSERLQHALGAFKDVAVEGLTLGEDATALERRLLAAKTRALAAAPDKLYTLERVFAQAIRSVTAVARGEVGKP